MAFSPLPSSGDNPALLAFKLATIAGLVALALRNSRAVGGVINAALAALSNMMRLVTGSWRGGAAGGGKV